MQVKCSRSLVLNCSKSYSGRVAGISSISFLAFHRTFWGHVELEMSLSHMYGFVLSWYEPISSHYGSISHKLLRFSKNLVSSNPSSRAGRGGRVGQAAQVHVGARHACGTMVLIESTTPIQATQAIEIPFCNKSSVVELHAIRSACRARPTHIDLILSIGLVLLLKSVGGLGLLLKSGMVAQAIRIIS